jgi:hypothetical protein
MLRWEQASRSECRRVPFTSSTPPLLSETHHHWQALAFRSCLATCPSNSSRVFSIISQYLLIICYKYKAYAIYDANAPIRKQMSPLPSAFYTHTLRLRLNSVSQIKACMQRQCCRLETALDDSRVFIERVRKLSVSLLPPEFSFRGVSILWRLKYYHCALRVEMKIWQQQRNVLSELVHAKSHATEIWNLYLATRQ